MWKTVKLGDVCELIYGKALPESDRLEGKGYPAYGANGLKTYSKKPLYEKPSIIVGRKGSAGEINKIDIPFWALDVTYYVVNDESVIDLVFLYHVLRLKNLPNMARGVKPGINRNDVYSLEFSLPSLSEQHRIVAKLDAAFAQIDKAIDAAGRKQEDVEKLKQAVLANKLDVHGDIKKLGDVCNFQNGFAFKSTLFKETGKPILRISNIQNQEIDVRKTVYFNTDDYDTNFTRYEVKPDDLLIAMSGATTGKIGFNKTDITFYLNQRVGNIKPKPALDKTYLYYLLSTKVEDNLSISKGAAQPNLSSEQIKNIRFFLPPLAEQHRIVAKLDATFTKINVAKEATAKQIANHHALKSAILASELQSDAA